MKKGEKILMQHFVMLLFTYQWYHNNAHETSPPPPLPPQGPLQPELVTLSMENEALRQHIDSLERQLVHVKTEREKTAAAQRVIISQHSRDNSSLRANVGKSRKDVEDMKKLCFEKERMYQTTLTQLVAAQDDIKRLKIELRHVTDGITESANMLGTAYGSSKYGFEEVMSLRAINDTLRYELNKERSARNVEKLSLHSGMEGVRLKSNAGERQIADLRELVDSERRKLSLADEEQHRLQLQLQTLQFEFAKADAKRTESMLESIRLKDKIKDMQQEYDDLVNSKERSDKDWSERCQELTQCMHTLRVGLAELQGELVNVSSKGGEEIQRLALDRARITLRLESLLEENDHLWSSSKLQDKHLRRSSDRITTLASQLQCGSNNSTNADTELLVGRQAQLLSTATLQVEDKWAHKLATETEQLTLQLTSTQQQ